MKNTVPDRFRLLFAVACLTLLTAPAVAGPIYTFSVSDGVQPSNVGTITLTQVDSTTVDVLVDLSDTTLSYRNTALLIVVGPIHRLHSP